MEIKKNGRLLKADVIEQQIDLVVKFECRAIKIPRHYCPTKKT